MGDFNICGNTLIDNCEGGKMCDAIRFIFSKPEIKTVKIATGYWDLPGLALLTAELREFLQRDGAELQLLIGTDPVVRINQQNNPKVKRFPEDAIKVALEELDVRPEYVDSVELLKEYCKVEEAESKFKIHIYRTDEQGDAKFLHAKCYIFDSDDETRVCYGIAGSSNFTKNGLRENDELNALETSPAVITALPKNRILGHIHWFDERWAVSKPWNREFIEEVLLPSPVGKAAEERKAVEKTQPEPEPLTPYEHYIKFLQMQFGDIADPSLNAVMASYLPTAYDSYTFQIDAAKSCYAIMKEYGGFMLSDVVGLGKTVIGLMVIRRFIDEAESLGRPKDVLVIAPPAIKKAWDSTIVDFDKGKSVKIGDFIKTISTGKLDAFSDIDKDDNGEGNGEFDEALEYKDYGLIVVDESHGFRNNATKKYEDLDNLISQITTNRIQPYVGLLSATPQNNDPNDLRYQIYLFQREPKRATKFPEIEGYNLDAFFAEKHQVYEQWKHHSDTPEGKLELMRLSTDIRERVLKHILVRRTRKDIKNGYTEEGAKLKFPTVKGPNSLVYEMDAVMSKLFDDTVRAITTVAKEGEPMPDGAIGFYRYCGIMFFADEKNRKLYEKRNMTVQQTSRNLQKMMRTLLVKRLESSKNAFESSLLNLKHYTQNMLDMLDHDCVFICPDIDVNSVFEKVGYDFAKAQSKIREKIEKKGGNNREFRAADFTADYKQLLERDMRLIDRLYARWTSYRDDPKLNRFIDSLRTELFNPAINNPSGYDSPRLVIFTEAKDTQQLLEREIRKQGHRVLSVSADNRDKVGDAIKANFDANAPADIRRDSYDVIVTTEVLAEGVNLHRANVILNYDTPWNATRLMQRIGRVNRIGSREDFVHVFNFKPSAQGNEQISLLQNAYSKLQTFHILFGEDSKVFLDNEEIPDVDLQNLVDGDESEATKYIVELKEYMRENPLRYAWLQDYTLQCEGGEIDRPGDGSRCAIVHADKRGDVCLVKPQGEPARVVSALEFCAALKCSPADRYKQPSASLTADDEKDIMHQYNQHVGKPLTGRGTTKQVNAARAAVKWLRDNYRHEFTDEAKRRLTEAEQAATAGNKTVINALLKLQADLAANGASMFGAGEDINSVISNQFARIAQTNTKHFGTPQITLYTV